jgi:leucyl aminopeptidase
LLASEVADLRNTARAPQLGVSTPAQFIAEHLGDFGGAWLHLDIEGVATTEAGRGTGFGVGLLLRTFGYC